MKAMQALFAVLGLAFALPALIGLADAYSWLMTGEQLSWMQWNSWRLMLTGGFMIPAAAMATAFLSARDAADR